MVEMFDTEYDSFVDTAHAFRNDDQLTTNSEGYYTLAHDTGKSPNSVDSPFDKEIRKAAQAHAYAVVAEMRAEEAKHIRAAQKLEKHKQYLDDLAEQRWHASLRKATNN
jgi:hypothetical protein